METKFQKLIVVTALFCSYNFTVLAETATFNTVTEALNWTGDKATVTKLIITGTISGDDYSKSSEWSKFRTLNETFPNIEEVEIWTDQDIPNSGWNGSNLNGALFGSVAHWLKSFSAPNIKYIGSDAFAWCRNLVTISFPSAETIANSAFYMCESLISIDSTTFPNVTIIGPYAFAYCKKLTSVYFPNVTTIKSSAFLSYGDPPDSTFNNLTSVNFPLVTTIGNFAFDGGSYLTSVSLGTGFETETEISFGLNVFEWSSALTQNIDLTLGEYVLPKPDTIAKTWQKNNEIPPYPVRDYIWKSIKIETDGIEEVIKNATVSIFPNPTVGNATVSFELEKSCNVKILLCDVLGIELANIYDGFANEGFFIETIDTGHLPKGVYFLKILIDGNYTVEKIIKY